MLVAVIVVIGILAAPQSLGETPIVEPTATAAPNAMPNLMIDLKGEQGEVVSLALQNSQGVTTSLNLELLASARPALHYGRLVSYTTTSQVAEGNYTATYMVRSFNPPTERQFSVIVSNTLKLVSSLTPALLAPDGNSIAYIINQQQFVGGTLGVRGTWTLYRADLGSDAATAIASGKLEDYAAWYLTPLCWTAATNQVYLRSWNSATYNPTIYSFAADGSGAGQRLELPSRLTFPAPDGSHLAYLDRDDSQPAPRGRINESLNNRIVLLDLANGSVSKIMPATDNYLEATLAWSPDGQSLVYIEHDIAAAQSRGPLQAHQPHQAIVKRRDLAANRSYTLGDYLSNPPSDEQAAQSEFVLGLAWCGERLYLPVTVALHDKQTTTLYSATPRTRASLAIAAANWPYATFGCVP